MFQNTGGPGQRNTKAINKINKVPNCGKFEVKEYTKFMVSRLSHSYSCNNGGRSSTSVINSTS